jgi:hypothetical protein
LSYGCFFTARVERKGANLSARQPSARGKWFRGCRLLGVKSAREVCLTNLTIGD